MEADPECDLTRNFKMPGLEFDAWACYVCSIAEAEKSAWHLSRNGIWDASANLHERHDDDLCLDIVHFTP